MKLAAPFSLLRILAAACALPILPLDAAWDLKSLEAMEKKTQLLTEKARPAVVALTHGMGRGIASGSGTVISRNGLILTAAHVVGDQKNKIHVTFADGKTATAKVLGLDFKNDVALLMIHETGEYPFVELSDAKNLPDGEMLVALGHMGGFDIKRGAPARLGRVLRVGDKIASDCLLAGGDSGGPLFDLNGKVVGVHHAVGNHAALNFDAPSWKVRDGWDKLIAGENLGKDPRAALASLDPKELQGLDANALFHAVMEKAMKTGGQLASHPSELKALMKKCGMKAEHADKLTDLEVSSLMKKCLAAASEGQVDVQNLFGTASASSDKPSAQELAGLDVKKFHELLTQRATKGGKAELAFKPEDLVPLLRDSGMDEAKAKAMNPADLAKFVAKVMSGAAIVKSSSQIEGVSPDAASKAPADLAGLDLDKLAAAITDRALQSGGKLALDSKDIVPLLVANGMSQTKAATLSAEELSGIVSKALAKLASPSAIGSVKKPSAEAATPKNDSAAMQQDREILETMKPTLSKYAASVVQMKSDGKVIAMGTVVRENGFILTKKSEITAAPEKLRVRLVGGIELPGRIVQTFDAHDLALVKVEATGLKAVSIPAVETKLAPGRLLFTPGNETASPLVAMGIISTPERSLQQSGGFLGVSLKEENKSVGFGGVQKDGPAAKAGLEKDDTVISVDGKTFESAPGLGAYIRSLKPGAKIAMKYRRKGEAKETELTLGDRGELELPDLHGASLKLGARLSERRSGFPSVFQHDQPLDPEQCGSIAVGLQGEILGVNVSRDSRIASFAIPAKVVAELMAKVDFAALERSPAR